MRVIQTLKDNGLIDKTLSNLFVAAPVGIQDLHRTFEPSNGGFDLIYIAKTTRPDHPKNLELSTHNALSQ